MPSLWSALPTRFSAKHHRSQSSRFCATPLRSNSLRSCAFATHVISLHYRYRSFLRQSPPCRYATNLCSANAVPSNAYTVPSKTYASHFNAEAVHYISQPSLLISELCPQPSHTLPQPCPSVHLRNISKLISASQCHNESAQFNAAADHCCTFPPLIGESHSRRYVSQIVAITFPYFAMPSHYRSTPFPRRTMRNLTVTLPCVTSPVLRLLPR
jgi:hypothetical protein